MYEGMLFLHVLGAIVGVGPTFAFSVLGPLASKSTPEGALALSEGMVGVSNRFVKPVTAIILPLTGLYLIFSTNRNENFFQHEWLWIAVLIYLVLMVIAFGFQNPGMSKMLSMQKAGSAGTPEFGQLAKRTRTLGPVMGIMLIVIVALMVMKPGD